MGKKILDSKILYMILSIVLTVGLWCYVTATDGTPRDDVYRRGSPKRDIRGNICVNDHQLSVSKDIQPVKHYGHIVVWLILRRAVRRCHIAPQAHREKNGYRQVKDFAVKNLLSHWNYLP